MRRSRSFCPRLRNDMRRGCRARWIARRFHKSRNARSYSRCIGNSTHSTIWRCIRVPRDNGRRSMLSFGRVGRCSVVAFHQLPDHPDETARLLGCASAPVIVTAHVVGNDDIFESVKRRLKVFDIASGCAGCAFEIVRVVAAEAPGRPRHELPESRRALIGYRFIRAAGFGNHQKVEIPAHRFAFEDRFYFASVGCASLDITPETQTDFKENENGAQYEHEDG